MLETVPVVVPAAPVKVLPIFCVPEIVAFVMVGGFTYLITTIPDPPEPALSRPEFVKPPAPPPPVFVLPLLEEESG